MDNAKMGEPYNHQESINPEPSLGSPETQHLALTHALNCAGTVPSLPLDFDTGRLPYLLEQPRAKTDQYHAATGKHGVPLFPSPFTS
jgi:hypothetical protein